MGEPDRKTGRAGDPRPTALKPSRPWLENDAYAEVADILGWHVDQEGKAIERFEKEKKRVGSLSNYSALARVRFRQKVFALCHTAAMALLGCKHLIWPNSSRTPDTSAHLSGPLAKLPEPPVGRRHILVIATRDGTFPNFHAQLQTLKCRIGRRASRFYSQYGLCVAEHYGPLGPKETVAAT
jgi:hypothetical protein